MSLYADLAAVRSATDPLAPGEWLLIDAAVLANAVYFAERSRSKREDGIAAVEDPQPVVTGPRLYDFACSLLDRFQPSHALAAWDGPHNWRKAPPSEGGITAYKAGRPEKPYGLRALLRIAPEVFRAAGVANVRVDGHEADDVIASACRRAASGAVIVSNDKDFAQCLERGVRWWNPLAKLATGALDAAEAERGEWVTADTVREKWGVRAEWFTEYQALAGDASDCVKGCPGIGAVGAAQLVGTYSTIDRILEAAQLREPAAAKYADKLLAGAESIRESLRAVTLATHLDVTAEPVGPRQECPMFANPFKKPAAPGQSVTDTLTAQTRQVEAPTPDETPSGEAPEAPVEAEATRSAPPPPKRGRPPHVIPDHPAIPQGWRNTPKGQLRANTVGRCRNELAKAARDAGHTDVAPTTPETRAAALVEQVAALVELLTGARPWLAAEAPEATEEAGDVVVVEDPAKPAGALDADTSDKIRANAHRATAETVRNAVACRQAPEVVLERATATAASYPESLAPTQDEILVMIREATRARMEREQAPEGYSPNRTPTPAPKTQPAAAAAPTASLEAAPPAAPVPPEPAAGGVESAPAAERPRLYIDCQPLDGSAVELDVWAEPFSAEVCVAKNVGHVLLCPYAEGPKLVATLVSRHRRAGGPIPSLVVRRASPLADACLPELRQAFGRGEIVEATR